MFRVARPSWLQARKPTIHYSRSDPKSSGIVWNIPSDADSVKRCVPFSCSTVLTVLTPFSSPADISYRNIGKSAAKCVRHSIVSTRHQSARGRDGRTKKMKMPIPRTGNTRANATIPTATIAIGKTADVGICAPCASAYAGIQDKATTAACIQRYVRATTCIRSSLDARYGFFLS